MHTEEFLYNLARDKQNRLIFLPLKFILFLLSLVYGLVVRFSVFACRIKPAYRLKCKVISVGNITLGGTGKTSLVEFIARRLKQDGHKVAVISRGYKRKITLGKGKTPDYESMGDEPYMVSQKLNIPVIVDSDRVRASEKAVSDYGVDTVIFDDGFQQWRIKKDLEIVVIDSGFTFGNRCLIPRGTLREPLSSLKRADIFVLTKTDTSPDTKGMRYFLGEINPGALIVESVHKPVALYKVGKAGERLGLESLKGKSVALFSGIGDPESFEKTAEAQGFKIGLSARFPDHYHYSEKDLERIMAEAQGKNIEAVITTEKDAARLGALPIASYPLPVMALRIELAIPKDEQVFCSRLLGLYHP